MPEINWMVFQRQENGTPVEFAELLWCSNQLFHRIGKLKTFGSSDATSFADAKERTELIALQRSTIESGGFKLVREWHFDPARFDFRLLQRELELATKQCVTQLQEKYPHLNAFALATDDDAMTILPIAHAFDAIVDADDDVLWNPDEWQIWDGDTHFDIAYRLILSQFRDSLTKVDYDAYKSGFAESVISALENLDSQGLLGDRDKRVLMYHVTDSDQLPAAIKRLNSRNLFSRWEAWS